jgi:hypothetical protein
MRLMPRLGKKKALVAVEHSILTAVWHMLTQDTGFHDLGGDYYTKHNPERALRRITRQANALGQCHAASNPLKRRDTGGPEAARRYFRTRFPLVRTI